MTPKITVAIPSHNNIQTIEAAIASCQMQDYPHKEILVCDDASTDGTYDYAKVFSGVTVIKNEKNLGIGKNLEKLMQEAKGKYIVYLCADDIFTHPSLLTDIVNQFDNGDKNIGIIGRYFYFFMDKCPGAIGTCRDKNILTSSCCPSGLAFRRMPGIIASNKIFVEMPSIVAQYLKVWRWTMFEWDTVGARFKPGTNTGTKKEYYTESPWQNWVDLTGDTKWQDFPSFLMLKNRAPNMLLSEIKLAISLNKKILRSPKFYFYALVALATPSSILRRLTNFYRHRIARLTAKIIERPS